jgi:hypothetical protein
MKKLIPRVKERKKPNRKPKGIHKVDGHDLYADLDELEHFVYVGGPYYESGSAQIHVRDTADILALGKYLTTVGRYLKRKYK